MEISVTLKSNIKDVQKKLTKAIENHQAAASKLKDDPAAENDTKSELIKIQKEIMELNEKQKVLLQQLRKEIEDSITNGRLPGYNFNLYKIKPGQLESKKRRRKDTTLTPKVIASVRSQREPSLSPSPTPSSSSSMSDDSLDYDVAPYMMPVPVPKARPKLLPDSKENLYLGAVTRRDLRPPKLKKKYLKKYMCDADIYKDIPVYYDPVPSPPPTDEKDLKARFMTALALIPKEMLHEIQNRKVERKRRSTATNNPNFVYNNDWEIPVWKRSRTYLSPHKLSKIETVIKKSKVDDVVDDQKEVKKESDSADAKRILFDNIKLPPGLTVEKVDGKSRNSTPDSSTSANMLCFICKTSGLVSVCKECSTCYHLNCISPGSPICCPNCKNKRSTDDNSSEDSVKEEFAAKCPNVAESYNKLKEYIQSHADTDYTELINEREQFKVELMMKNQELYAEKEKLEERAAELSESLLLQEESKDQLLKQEQKLLAKIKIVRDFVILYQKTNKKPEPEEEEKPEEKTTSDLPENDENQEDTTDNVESLKDDRVGSVEPPESFETCDLLDEEKSSSQPLPDEKVKDDSQEVRTGNNFENYASPAPSTKESLENSINNYDSLFSLSQENTANESLGNDSNANSPKNEENCESPGSSKGSIPNGEDNFGRDTPSSRESMTHPTFDLDEHEQFMAQAYGKNTFETDRVDYDFASDNEYY